jgi:hypothetical protein
MILIGFVNTGTGQTGESQPAILRTGRSSTGEIAKLLSSQDPTMLKAESYLKNLAMRFFFKKASPN